MSWSYSGDPSSSDKDAIRFEIQDTNPSAPLLEDAEVTWCVLVETGVAADADAATLAETNPQGFFSACARACESLARLFLAQADTQVGSLKTTYTKQAAQYAQQAKDLRSKAASLGAPYTGGQSVSEKLANALDPDQVQPAFSRDMFDSPWTGESQDVSQSDLGPPFPL